MNISAQSKSILFFLVLLTAIIAGASLSALDKKEYKIFIVSDTLGSWATDTQKGFKDNLDKQLAALGAKASYTVFDTKVDPSTIPDILKSIQDGKPDLIFTCNYPNGFADLQITSKLKDSKYRFVSLDPIPVEIGLIKNWQKPGGNVTGVGVFLQFTSTFKLALKINPKLKKLAFVTWDAMGVVNDWFESELKKAAREAGVELAEFRKVANYEEEIAFYKDYIPKAADHFVMVGITAFVHKDGTPLDGGQKDWYPFVQKEFGQLLLVSYDDTMVSHAVPAGTSVIWSDLGAQSADKALKILQGANPGDLPWEYPRKYNLVFNLQAARDRGITLPQDLINAAFRVYTDYKGNYVQGSK